MLLTLFFCVLIVQFLFGDANPVMGGMPAGKIIRKHGNRKEVIGRTDYPYMVYMDICEIVSESKTEVEQSCYHCGGSIIRRGALVTAAHCFTETVTNPEVFIYAGILHKDIEIGKVQEHKMWDYLIHEDYINEVENLWSTMYQHHDIAIVWVQEMFNFNKEINQIPLISPYAKIENKKGFILGWGRTENGQRSRMLLKGEMKILSNQLCHQFYPHNEFTYGMICALSERKTTTSCRGDSGGPLVIDGKLVALMSFNRMMDVTLKNGETVPLCNPKVPAVLTYVAKYQRWIEDNLLRGPPRDWKLKASDNDILE